MNAKASVQYAMAILLIVSSIVLVFINESKLMNIANGVLLYVAQAFLLAGSIFGLQSYINKFNDYVTKRTKESQPT